MGGFAKVFTKPSGDTNPTTSVVKNEVFMYLVSVLDNEKQEDLWDLLFRFQLYPEPNVFLRNESFAERVSNTEPGKKINYQKLRQDLEMAQDDLSCHDKETEEVFKQCNDAIQAHVEYVRATTFVLIYDLYDQLIDRFYGRIIDEPFQHFMVQRAAPFFPSNWPAYDKTKRTYETHLQAAQRVRQQTCEVIEQLKSSKSFKGILTRLKSTIERCEDRQRNFASRVQIWTSRKSSAEAHGRLSQSQRKAMIQNRNQSADYDRALRNYHYKQANLLNTHQLGNQSRVNIPDAVIHALVEIQAGYQNIVLENDKEDIEGVDKANIHIGVGQADVLSEKERDEKWLKMGIVIPDGFVDLAPIFNGGGAGDG